MTNTFQKWVKEHKDNLAVKFLDYTNDYEKRKKFIESVESFLLNAKIEDLSGDVINALGIVASDTLSESFIESIPLEDKLLVTLTEKMSTTSHEEAKGELAGALARVEQYKSRAIKVLELLCNDKEEFTSRKALLSLSILGSDNVEMYAEKAWASGLSYQRIASIHALSEINSPMLNKYLDLGKSDGRLFVVKNVLEIEEKNA